MCIILVSFLRKIWVKRMEASCYSNQVRGKDNKSNLVMIYYSVLPFKLSRGSVVSSMIHIAKKKKRVLAGCWFCSSCCSK